MSYGVPAAAMPVESFPSYSAPVEGIPAESSFGHEGGEVARRARQATVIVKAPADAKVTVNGTETVRKTEEESFLTPELKKGYVYSYTFKAEAVRDGKTVTKSQKVMVRAGQKSEVDFTELASTESKTERLTAKLTVIMPRNATLYVDGTAFTTNNTTNTFETPKLEAGKLYYYNLKVRFDGGRDEKLTKRVRIQAGKDVTVNFAEELNTRASVR